MCKPMLLGKIVPAGFSLSNLFLCFSDHFSEIHRNSDLRAYLRDAVAAFLVDNGQLESSVTPRSASGRDASSSTLPKIIFPEAVCNTLVTVISTARPIIRRA